INPIGSGPYMINNTKKETSGVVNSYTLKPFTKFTLGKPYIKTITLRFYSNENNMISALKNGSVEQISSISPENAELLKNKNYDIKSTVLPRVFGLFFNQNQNQIFTNKNVNQAIALAINKERIVTEVLKGYGTVIENPIPNNIISYQAINSKNDTTHEERLEKAKNILIKDGWKTNTDGFLEKIVTEKKVKATVLLEFSISTSNASDLTQAAEIIKQDLEAIGIKVNVKTFEIGNLNQGVIRPRKYDALLFGQIINHESDLFAFWHSSQRKDPGLNVAMYTNVKVDKILEDAFTTIDETNRINKYSAFQEEIRKDVPAVFLYSPNLIYITKNNTQGINLNHVTSPKDRWNDVYLWYIDTDNVWKIFTN
ncbi:MAG: ABC transporter substrate-binding protein, partial [bacterium]|nr:ABC transporter substrate-binding protein [bacterium]